MVYWKAASQAGNERMIFELKHGALPGSLELAWLGDCLYDLYEIGRAHV